MNLEQTLEGILFYKAEPVSKTELARLLRVNEEEIAGALQSLRETLSGRGIALLESDTDVQLMTAPALSETIETIRREELRRDIGKAGAETLAIILYRGPLTRAEIDFIRGVNSTFILRNLLMRGLIERTQHPTDQRAFQYRATTTLLAHLGITKKDELPNYEDIMNELDRYEREQKEQEATEHTNP